MDTPTQARTVARTVLDEACTERQFQDAVVELAKWHKWTVFHDEDSRRNERGLPDLLIWRGPGVLLMWELKKESGVLSTDQKRWLRHLATVPGVDARCLRPSNWGYIEAVLSAPREEA